MSQREALAFSAFVTEFEAADVPLVVVKVCRAEPALAAVAEGGGGFVAGLIQGRNGLASGPGLFFAERFPCRLRFHEAPRWGDCTLRGEIGKRKSEDKERAISEDGRYNNEARPTLGELRTPKRTLQGEHSQEWLCYGAAAGRLGYRGVFRGVGGVC